MFRVNEWFILELLKPVHPLHTKIQNMTQQPTPDPDKIDDPLIPDSSVTDVLVIFLFLLVT